MLSTNYCLPTTHYPLFWSGLGGVGWSGFLPTVEEKKVGMVGILGCDSGAELAGLASSTLGPVGLLPVGESVGR